jgi:sugar lactone lactonase YvrE
MSVVFDHRRCTLGEGALWHPLRKQLFWFDISGKKLLSRQGAAVLEWRLDETCSAAGWIDEDNVLVASATGLWKFCLTDGARSLITPLERANAMTRSNDGRADPWGGFWIGTMGRNAETGAGAIYRFYQGQLRKLFSAITISNAIAFAPNRSHAFFTDTATQCVMRVGLDRTGWPASAPDVFVDLSSEDLNPDGAVVSADGSLWIAQWGASRIACYDAQGRFQRAVPCPALQVSCPAFGGPDLCDLYATSATQGLPKSRLEAEPDHGLTFVTKAVSQGLPEPKVLL